jgi:exodeoxyribonuclease VII large subunit
VIPSRVQGEGAERELCAALDVVNRILDLDVVVVARGGGSLEDLWAFNSEPVARALAAVRVPTVSAVGHETDVSLTDLVADVRAPTPSAAAEAVVPSRQEMIDIVNVAARRLATALASHTDLGRERLARTADRLAAGMQIHLAGRRAALDAVGGKLDALSPLKVLRRGYSVARDDAGHVLKRVGDFRPTQPFRLTVSDGELHARALGAEEADGPGGGA